jgi:hypothetical protein
MTAVPEQQVVATPADEPSTADLLEFYATQHVITKRLKAELASVEAVLDGLEEILLERIPPGLDSMAFVTTAGHKMKVSRRETERFQPEGGHSDDFWAWAQKNNRWDMASRTVLQAGVKEYAAKHNAYPPFIERAVTEKCAITVTVAAPKL